LEKIQLKGRSGMSRFVLSFLILFSGIIFCSVQGLSAEKVSTKILIRVVSKDAKVVGSGVGGASVRIVNVDSGEILAQGKQEGGTGDTDRIMVQPRRRGDAIYGTPGAAFFQTEIPLDRPTRVEIQVAAPLAYPQSIQKGSKTLVLIPGRHILGEGVIIELDGLIVNVLEPMPTKVLKKGGKLNIKVEVKML
jgi:hypothetical protein